MIIFSLHFMEVYDFKFWNLTQNFQFLYGTYNNSKTFLYKCTLLENPLFGIYFCFKIERSWKIHTELAQPNFFYDKSDQITVWNKFTVRNNFFPFQDNEISSFKRGTFHSQANPELRILDLSFNLITDIQYDTFRFPRLERLLLDDNRIQTLDSKSFVEMTQLVYLSLEGNKLTHVLGKVWKIINILSKLIIPNVFTLRSC